MNVLLACHAGPDVGLGHLSRLMALADGLVNKATLSLIIQGKINSKKKLKEYAYQLVDSDQAFYESVLLTVQQNKVEVVIFDVYPKKVTELFIEFLKSLRSLAVKIIGIDGFMYCAFCDYLHIPAFYVDSMKLKKCTCPISYGWNSYLLSKKNSNVIWNPGNNILVLTGGSDITKLNLTWPVQIDAKFPGNYVIHWVKGPFSDPPFLPRKTRLSWVIYDAPESLSDVMSKVHYAITPYGVSFFELLQQGIPTVVFSPYGDRDKDELGSLRNENICLVGDNEIDSINKLVYLMKNNELASSFSKSAKSKLQTSGSEMLAKQIVAMGVV